VEKDNPARTAAAPPGAPFSLNPDPVVPATQVAVIIQARPGEVSV
jgi:hypothetical protein